MTEAGPGRLFDEYMNTINCTSPAARASVTDIYYLHTNTRYLLSTIPRDIHLLGSLALAHGVLEVHEPGPVEQQRGHAQHEVEGQVGPGDGT